MVTLEPLKITITNYPHEGSLEIPVPDFPSEPTRGQHTVKLNRVLYIEASDFKEVPEAGYRRLTPNQTVGLRHAGYVLTVRLYYG